MLDVMRGHWSSQRVLAVGVGGIAGAGLRWVVLTTATPTVFPSSLLAINIAGSMLLGALLAAEPTHPSRRTLLHDAGGIGFCGGLTTFSTFALEIVNLARAGNAAIAGLYASASVVGAVVGVFVGAAALRQVRAVALPLEEEP